MAKMHPHRLRYEKSGRAIYISHLDTMAMFQRAFLRAGLDIWQTEGFNRHAYVSIALPLSVGFSSQCEVLEFNLLSQLPLSQIPERLNAVLPEGIRVLECYDAQVPFKKLRTLDWKLELIFDGGVPADLTENMNALLALDSLVVQKKSKKSKKGYTEQDLIPMIHHWEMEQTDSNTVTVLCRLAAQNPGMNPHLLLDAFAERYPQDRPDFMRCRRMEVYDEDGAVFR